MNETIEFEEKEAIPFSFIILLISVGIMLLAMLSSVILAALHMSKSWAVISFSIMLVGMTLPFSGIYAGYKSKPKSERNKKLNRFGFWANLIIYVLIICIFPIQAVMRAM